MKTFDYEGRECTVDKDGTLLTKVSFGPEAWGTEAWVPLKLSNPEEALEGPTLTFENFPKIPYDTIQFVGYFFQEVYEQHRSEAFVYFSLDYETGKYDVFVPPSQQASSGHVSFDNIIPKYCGDCFVGNLDHEADSCVSCGSTNMKKSRVVGTAHSHGSMAAFHSATDDANELDTTGFHITFGKVNQKAFELAHSYVVAKRGLLNEKGQGIRFKENLPITELIELPFPDRRHIISRWVSLVVSDPALKRLEDTSKVLIVNDTIISLTGDLDQYSRIGAMMQTTGQATEDTTKVVTYAELKKLIEEARKKKTASAVGSKQSTTAVTKSPTQSASAAGGKMTTEKTTYHTGTSTTVVAQKRLKDLWIPGKSVVKFAQRGLAVSADEKGRIGLKNTQTNTSEYVPFFKIFTSKNSQYESSAIFRCFMEYSLTWMTELTDSCVGEFKDRYKTYVGELSDQVLEIIGYCSAYDETLYTESLKAFGDKTCFETHMDMFGGANLISEEVAVSDRDELCYQLLTALWFMQECILNVSPGMPNQNLPRDLCEKLLELVADAATCIGLDIEADSYQVEQIPVVTV